MGRCIAANGKKNTCENILRLRCYTELLCGLFIWTDMLLHDFLKREHNRENRKRSTGTQKSALRWIRWELSYHRWRRTQTVWQLIKTKYLVLPRCTRRCHCLSAQCQCSACIVDNVTISFLQRIWQKTEEKFFVLMRQLEENSFVRAVEGAALIDKRWTTVDGV